MRDRQFLVHLNNAPTSARHDQLLANLGREVGGNALTFTCRNIFD